MAKLEELHALLREYGWKAELDPEAAGHIGVDLWEWHHPDHDRKFSFTTFRRSEEWEDGSGVWSFGCEQGKDSFRSDMLAPESSNPDKLLDFLRMFAKKS